jgi:hypothetical protein
MPKTLELQWQWPAGREKQSTCRARITKIYSNKKLFDSPSRTDFIPDPFVIEADVLEAPFQSVLLRLPAVEIENLQIGDEVQLDLIDTDICIALQKLN